MRFNQLLLLSSLLFIQALSVAAQGTPEEVESDQQVTESLDTAELDTAESQLTVTQLTFKQTTFDPAREGYVSLEWNKFPGGVSYEVVDSQLRSQYRGAFPSAFISGLSDGQHSFLVTAFDATGNPIATSEQPAELTVSHWPKNQAFILFGIGFVVFLAIILVLIIGSLKSSNRLSTAISNDTELA